MKTKLIISGRLLIAGSFFLASCAGQPSEDDGGPTYRDTVESTTPLNGNNMRNEQPTEELSKKDSIDTDSM